MSDTAKRQRGWLWWLSRPIAWPIGIALLVLLGGAVLVVVIAVCVWGSILDIVSFVASFVVTSAWGLRMRVRGRRIGRRELWRRLSDGHGTLIADQPKHESVSGRLWYADEDVLAESAWPVLGREAMAFARVPEPCTSWVRERYLDEKNGRARLVWASGGFAALAAWENRLPRVRSVRVWTCALAHGMPPEVRWDLAWRKWRRKRKERRASRA